MERDADFLHKKAERATLRVCLREKYRLPKVSHFAPPSFLKYEVVFRLTADFNFFFFYYQFVRSFIYTTVFEKSIILIEAAFI